MAGGAPFTPGQLVKREIVRKEERRWGLGFVPWSLTCEKGGLHLGPFCPCRPYIYTYKMKKIKIIVNKLILIILFLNLNKLVI